MSQDASESPTDIDSLSAQLELLTKSGQVGAEHATNVLQSAKAASAKVDQLRQFLEEHVKRSWAEPLAKPAPLAGRQRVIDSISEVIYHISNIESVIASIADPARPTLQKFVTFILGKIMQVLQDFKKHLQYENWSLSISGGFPFSIQVGFTITFQ